MEQFFSVLDKFISGSARIGWILLILGASLLALSHYEILPPSDVIPGWKAFFWLSTVLGATILIVSFGAWSLHELTARISKSKDERQRRAKANDLIKKGTENLPLLPHIEMRALIWILANKSEKFIDSNFAYRDANGLLERGIIFNDLSSGTNDTFIVNPLIWGTKDEILARHIDLTNSPKPW